MRKGMNSSTTVYCSGLSQFCCCLTRYQLSKAERLEHQGCDLDETLILNFLTTIGCSLELSLPTSKHSSRLKTAYSTRNSVSTIGEEWFRCPFVLTK